MKSELVEQLDNATRLAYDRTWLAYERTMQAWVRTALSCITFGFGVYKLAEIVAADVHSTRVAGPREIGLGFVSLGLVALAVSTLEYRQSIAVLRREYGKSPRSHSVWFAGAVALLGIFALSSMLFNI
jgi:putative membrane protein